MQNVKKVNAFSVSLTAFQLKQTTIKAHQEHIQKIVFFIIK